jgi:uncharacterized protein (DUF3820 family)
MDNFADNQLVKLTKVRMPYGKFQGTYLIDLPEYYITWYQTKGFPTGELGTLLGLLYEIKLNGLEYLVRPLA